MVDYSTHAADDPKAVMETWPVHRRGFENDAYRQARVDFVFFNAYAVPSCRPHPCRSLRTAPDDVRLR